MGVHMFTAFENILWQHWLFYFRAEVIIFLGLAVYTFPEIIKDLRGASRRSVWALAGLVFLYGMLLWLRAGREFRGFSEEWEELKLAKMVLAGDMVSFQALFRHGTTWPFLLADWFRFAGARPETVVWLNLSQSLLAAPLLFIASRLLFRSEGAALMGVLLFIAWPETAMYTAFTGGKTAFVIFGVAVFIYSFAAAFRFPRPSAFAQLFLAADLVAKTRQEFAVLYVAAAVLLYWKASARNIRMLLPVMLPLAALYYPLFMRGVACHLRVTFAAGDTMVHGAGEPFPWLLAAACAVTAAALLKNMEMLADRAWRVPALVALLTNIVYITHPAGFQNRLSAQALPALLPLLGWAVWKLAEPYRRIWLCAGVLPLAWFSWTAGGAPAPGAAGAALARFKSLAADTGAVVLFEDLDSQSQWDFLGLDRRSFPLRSVVPGWDDEGRHASVPARSFLGGRTVWLISRLRTQNSKLAEWEKVASGGAKKTGKYTEGDWQMRSYLFSGRRVDPHLSKALNDKGVEAWLKGDRRAAAELLKEALARDPENLEALIGYATVNRYAGNIAGCEKLVARARSISSGLKMPGRVNQEWDLCVARPMKTRE